MAKKYNSLAHTAWMCKYKGVKIIEGHMMPDHVHLLLAKYLKGKNKKVIENYIKKYRKIRSSIK